MSAHYIMAFDGNKDLKTGTLTLAQDGAHTLQYVTKWEGVTMLEALKIRDEIIEDAALNDVWATCEIMVAM